jgi:hypothetical protein
MAAYALLCAVLLHNFLEGLTSFSHSHMYAGPLAKEILTRIEGRSAQHQDYRHY